MTNSLKPAAVLRSARALCTTGSGNTGVLLSISI